MNAESTSRILTAAFVAATLHLPAAPVEEIDLSASDDSAEERAKTPVVTRTEDGYIDVTCEDTSVASVLQQFRRTTRMNILSSDSTNLSRRVSASLFHVPWCHALQSILGLANFKMDDRNGIWYVSEKTPEEVKCSTRYFVLKHASAADLADLFNGVAMKTSYEERNSIRSLTRSPGPANDGAGQAAPGGDEVRSAISGKARATAFPNTNTLVLTGSEENLNECEKIIAELDRPVTQVYIEARFIELSTEALHKLGIQWDQLQSWGMTAKGIKTGWESNTGEAANYGEFMSQKSVNNNKTASENFSASTSSGDGASSSANSSTSKNETKSDNTTYAGLVPTAIGKAEGAGASAESMAWRNASTFSGQLSADDFRLALSAFEKMQEGKMFSNPRIIVANGKEARVDMTTKEPNVEVQSDRSGNDGQYLSISTKLETIPGTDRNLFAGEAFFSYGITLSVKPRVSPSGLISVEVVPTISEKKEDKLISGADNNSVYTTYPVINIKSINTEFSMKDGATAVIGGLTQTKETDVDSGIPYLRKLPWLGPKLFGWQSREKVQSEILVLVTVGIANPETLRKDAGLPTNAVLGREYVEGRLLEPGVRPNAVKGIQNVDTRTLDQIREDPYQVKDEEVDLEGAAPAEEKATDGEEAFAAAEQPVRQPAPAAEQPKPAPAAEVAAPAPEAKPVPAPAPAAKAAAPEAKPSPAPAAKAAEPAPETKPAPAAKAEPAPAAKADVAAPAAEASTALATATKVQKPTRRKARRH